MTTLTENFSFSNIAKEETQKVPIESSNKIKTSISKLMIENSTNKLVVSAHG